VVVTQLLPSWIFLPDVVLSELLPFAPAQTSEQRVFSPFIFQKIYKPFPFLSFFLPLFLSLALFYDGNFLTSVYVRETKSISDPHYGQAA
jgi:hypothetical protein